ncbi:nucleoside recognition domain-containing protein [Thermodesulfatator atlanticus]|uniref:nucleoside recognition domain-containing protein n=1 Tax=Thermodesulfatator atlanticus TaxID=501497 RepID=UPI001C57D2A7
MAIMNRIWFYLLLFAVLAAAFNNSMEAVTKASFDAAKTAVNLAIGLVGAMTLWLGLVKVAEEGGLLRLIARRVKWILTRLFPNVPPEHPAMSAMVMNISANALGLGNAATPLGIKAMMELQKLNPHPERATDAMCLFLAINTSNVTLLPLGVIAVRAAAGCKDPAAILIPTLFATTCSTIAAVVAAKFLARLSGPEEAPVVSNENKAEDTFTEEKRPRISSLEKTFIWLLVFLIFLALLYRIWQDPGAEALKQLISFWLVPLLMLSLLLFGYFRGVPVYEKACEGGKEGFQVALKIIPFLVMILVAIAMFRASGAFDFLATLLKPITSPIGFPAEVLPVALLRPLSGSGAFGLMSEIVARAPDSFAAYLASTIQGSTETTFYVLAVYFGAVGIKDPRYAVWAALFADFVGVAAAFFICRLTY